MAFFSEIARHLAVLRDAFGDDFEAGDLPVMLDALADEAVVAALTAANGLVRAGEKVRIAAAGVASARSCRETGHDGLAQQRGHRSPVSLIQDITGATRSEAAKQVRLGEALRDGVAFGSTQDETTDAAPDAAAAAPVPRRSDGRRACRCGRRVRRAPGGRPCRHHG